MIDRIKILLVACFLKGISGVYAQETVVSTGGEATGSGGTSSYSIGQVAYTTNTGSSGSLAQGVQQAYEFSIVMGVNVTEINLELVVFPNPTINEVTVKMLNISERQLNYQLYSTQGKLMKTIKTPSQTEVIDLQSSPVGTYLLYVLDSNTIIKTFKIIKK